MVTMVGDSMIGCFTDALKFDRPAAGATVTIASHLSFCTLSF